MSAEVIPFPRVKTVRPVFPSITGSMTIPVKSMDDLPLTGGAADLIMGCADTAPSEILSTSQFHTADYSRLTPEEIAKDDEELADIYANSRDVPA